MQDCIFCKIVAKEIPAALLYEGDKVVAFADIQPQAPVHILVIPKKHYSNLGEVPAEEMGVLQEMVTAARSLAEKQGIHEKGYRLALNTNREGGQSVYHVHLHLLGGKQLGPSLVG